MINIEIELEKKISTLHGQKFLIWNVEKRGIVSIKSEEGNNVLYNPTGKEIFVACGEPSDVVIPPKTYFRYTGGNPYTLSTYELFEDAKITKTIRVPRDDFDTTVLKDAVEFAMNNANKNSLPLDNVFVTVRGESIEYRKAFNALRKSKYL